VSNKKLFVVFLVPALVVFAGYGAWTLTKSDGGSPESASTSINRTTNDSQPNNQSQSGNPDSPVSNDNAEPVTRAEVAQHDSREDCWTIIDGNVYDLTSYIPRHPGGDDILEACGTDGSSLFNQRQSSGGERVGSGTPHSSGAKSQLQSLLVGPLAD
jgi:cytochrome b involved in lipid metabolism